MAPKGKILIIDDDPTTLNIFTALFLKEGFEKAMGAVTGKWVEKLLNEKKPDIILLDVTIAGEDTLDILKRIKISAPNLPVIMFADESNRNLAKEALKNGATSCIIKSLPTPEIIEGIRKELDQKPDKITGRKGSILVVDDDKEIADMVKVFLEKDGYSCQAVYDSKKVIDAVKSNRPKHVLLDIVMPDIDGIKLLQQIKRINSEIKVIMMTGVSDKDICISAVKKGASGYVTKPFSLQQLRATLLTTLMD